MSKQSWIVAGIKIAFVYVGTVIGAGFASGQEILQFFTVYGKYSMFSILIAAFLFIWVGISILKMGFRLKSRSFRDAMNLTFGSISPFVNAYLVLAMMMIGAAMLAGAGALFEEYARMPFWMGAGVTAVIVWIIVAFGMKGIFAINAWIIPVILVFNIFVFGYSLQIDGNMGNVIPAFDVTAFDVVKAGVSYASFNIVLSVGVLASAGAEADNPRALTVGGILGGGILGAMLLTSNYSLMRYLPEIYEFEVPMLYIVHHMGRFFCSLFAVVVWGAILTTLVANVFSVASAVHDIFKLSVHTSLLMTIAACFVLSFVGFSRIVAWIYPLLGVIGFVVICVMFFLIREWK